MEFLLEGVPRPDLLTPEGSEKTLIRSSISHYRLSHKLGEGGMGVVYLAEDIRLNRKVVLKMLRPDRAPDATRQQRFLFEAQAASALNHPNIVTIYDVGRQSDTDYIVMEYVQGRTLAEMIGPIGLPLQDVVHYAWQIADALAAAHKEGIVHRDLKPANIMVKEDGLVKVLDFGLAKQLDAPLDAFTTTSGVILGTAAYMSPEQAQGLAVDARSDIFSFGVMLYQMLCGRPPFQGGTPGLVMAEIVASEPEPIRKVAPEVPHELELVITRCLQKSADRRPSSIQELKATLDHLRLQSLSGRLGPVTPPILWLWRRWWKAAVGVALGSLLMGGLAWYYLHPSRTPVRLVYKRMTNDAGLSFQPALSRDGKLLAYASDRAGTGNLDIWVRQVGGTEPIRLTSDAADEVEPSFSPDGTQVAYRSERDGGGIYVIPALGGTPRLLAARGRRPQFSPDGNWIAYWTGEVGVALTPQSARLWMVSSEGGQPRPVHSEFAVALYPVWLPDSKHLLAVGRREVTDPVDWWMLNLEDDGATVTGVCPALRRQKVDPPPGENTYWPSAWLAASNHVLLSARSGDSVNLWEIPISVRKGIVDGQAVRVSNNSGIELSPTVAEQAEGTPRGFASLVSNIDVWSLPVDVNRGRVTGEMKRLTEEVSFDGYPSISRDGRWLAFVSSRSGLRQVWCRNLVTNDQRPITSARSHVRQMKLSADGTTVAYFTREPENFSVYTATVDGNTTEHICRGCGVPTHISSDGKRLLLDSVGSVQAIVLLDRTTGKQRHVVELGTESPEKLFSARFSPDEQWVAFHAQTSAESRRLYIVPVQQEPVPRAQWVEVTSGPAADREAYWSPDGNLLYFLSNRDGFRCIWARRLGPDKRPQGETFAVQHFHSARRSLARMDDVPGAVGLAAGAGMLVFALGELTGNIWLVEAEH